ncbi:MAG: 2TM domain-containing protein [Bacteroidetes bacterium]|nr:2TM domain-containing protein [Bacteroidota bacterium]
MNRKLDKKIGRWPRSALLFKRHLFAYIVVNIFLVGLWYFQITSKGNCGLLVHLSIVRLGYWIGFNYWSAYRDDRVPLTQNTIRLKQSW